VAEGVGLAPRPGAPVAAVPTRRPLPGCPPPRPVG